MARHCGLFVLLLPLFICFVLASTTPNTLSLLPSANTTTFAAPESNSDLHCFRGVPLPFRYVPFGMMLSYLVLWTDVGDMF